MHECVFIKTWINDLCWLRYCLASIEKYYTTKEVVLVLDEDCTAPTSSLPIKIHYVPKHENGYIKQQEIKLNAHRYTRADYILFVDSDVIFTQPCSIHNFLNNDIIKLYYEPYSDLPTIPWKEITERHFKQIVEFEYMRRFPIVHHRAVLKGIQSRYPKLNSTLNSMTTREFSEFNFMGAFAHTYMPEFYQFMLPDSTPLVAKQYWSWGGLLPHIEKEIKENLYGNLE